MASNPNQNKKGPKRKAAPEEGDQIIAYVEEYVAQLCYDNDLRTILIAEKNKAFEVLIAEKYTTLNYLNFDYLTHGDNPQTFVVDLHFLLSKNTHILEFLNQLVDAKRNLVLAYEAHCKKALKFKADMRKKNNCFDEFTGMNYHDLKKTILNAAKEEQEIRAKTALKSEELKKKLEFINATKKSMNNNIRVLNQIEQDAM
uniref:GG22880 n=2 Tax=Drosophila erecta TaxID=7220 RepID=B3NZ62_DROER